MNNNKDIKLSVITVVFDDKFGLEKTIQSVINQTYNNVEFIVIDGGSTDGTVDIIKKYEDKIDYWISKSDSGIYDAMNKGINAATGTWVNFMNAGDIFVNYDVLASLDFKEYKNKALVYGNKIQNAKVIKPFNLGVLKNGIIMGNHQSMFFNTSVLRNDFIYNLDYPIYADYELVNKIFTKNYLIQYVDKDIADFEGGGISSVVSTQKRKDKYKIVYKYYGLTGLFGSVFDRLIRGKK